MSKSPHDWQGSDLRGAKSLLVGIEEVAKLRAIAPGQERMYLEMAILLASVGATEDQITEFAKRIAKGDA